MKYTLLLVPWLTCFISMQLYSQVIESNSNREKRFAFEVKQIDEFFERFNFKSNSLIASYINLKYPNIKLTRESLLTSLFDAQHKNWNMKDVNDFIHQVIDSVNPACLSFYSTDWFAETICKFKYKDKSIDVAIILQVQRENGGFKWMLVGAYSRALIPLRRSLILPFKKHSSGFLNPMSHATGFISLSRAFENKAHIQNYLDSSFLKYPFSRAFIRALLNNQLQYQFVKEIKYHVLQVDGWIFTVNCFKRQSINSGWLISSLNRATRVDKDVYRSHLFH